MDHGTMALAITSQHSATVAVAGLPRPSTLRQGREQFPEFCFVSL